jgi:hypothetical protein
MNAPTACAHDWQPIEGWYARYRCARCRVIGYKPGAVHPGNPRGMAIVPYRCESKCHGARCSEPAVHNWKGAKFRCAAHGGPAHTGPARKALDGEQPSTLGALTRPDAAPARTAEEGT